MTMSDTQNHGITRLVAQYFQLIDPKSLAIPPPCILKRSSVQAQIYNEMFDEDSLAPVIPPAGYRLRVLKSIVTRIEASEEWDPEEDVYLVFFLYIIYSGCALKQALILF